jgi:hypothetical protein
MSQMFTICINLACTRIQFGTTIQLSFSLNILIWYGLNRDIYILLAEGSKKRVDNRSCAGIGGSNLAGGIDVFYECRVLSGRGLCDEPITRPEES